MGRGKSQRNLELIHIAAAILQEIQPASVRAVCYQLFVRKLIESMAKTCTNRVSTQLVYAREHGIIPWEHIVDESRAPERTPAWSDPTALLDAAVEQYRKDRWLTQPNECEVWAEKGTVRGTLAPVLHAYGVTFRVMHGYGSATALHDVAVQSRALECPLTVFYVGDWDPSGLHMNEVDLPTRLDEYGANIILRRVAL